MALLTLLATSACEDRNVGIVPPDRQFFFPSGVRVDTTVRVPFADGDPVAAADTDRVVQAGRYLFVANGNNDLRFNAGTLVALDLQRFWDAWFDTARSAAYPYCEPDTGIDGLDRCTERPGVVVTEQRPCRRLALKPHVVECDERAFIDPERIVGVGDFATVIAASNEVDGAGNPFSRLWLPVRGDPSITYVDVSAAADGTVTLDCDGAVPPEGGPAACADAYRLRHARNDDALTELGREPFTMLITERGGVRLGFVAHAAGNQLTLIDLDGVAGSRRPAIVDQVPLFQRDNVGQGGFGLAERPCFGADPDEPGRLEPNVPILTEQCTRPLVYAGFRSIPLVSSFTASGLTLPSTATLVPSDARTDCFVDIPLSCGGVLEGCADDPAVCNDNPGGCESVYAGQYCATPEQLGQPCAVPCEPRVRADRPIDAGALSRQSFGPSLGDLAFADERGDTLLVLQTNPGALLVLDTSLGEDGEPLDRPSSPPIELCDEPTRMVVHTAVGGQRLAFVTCFSAALTYVVDLTARRVLDTIVVGTGPHDLAVDPDRQALYVVNTLESSISVVDVARHRSTRFQEIARIGLQEPFER